jgi:hypothetical protein
MKTLVVDVGDNIVGIFFVEDNKYHPYQDEEKLLAIKIIQSSDEVVTYNGKNYDLKELGKFVGLDDNLPLQGTHTDMRSVCWSDRIWGKNLFDTYFLNFSDKPTFPRTHAGSNESDVYMTFKLWELWKHNKLKTLDGRQLSGTDEL